MDKPVKVSNESNEAYQSRLFSYKMEKESQLNVAAPDLLAVAKLAYYIAGGGYVGMHKKKVLENQLSHMAQKAIEKAIG